MEQKIRTRFKRSY